MSIVVQFPQSRPDQSATRINRLPIRLREAIGRLLTRLRLGGMVREIELTDELTGQKVEIRVNTLFTRISLNGRDYYFDRMTGRFDGTGVGCG